MNFHPSLFRQLLAWLFAALFGVWGAFIWFGYQTGLHEADELTDGHLASVAFLISAQPTVPASPPASPAPTGMAPLKAHDYQQSLSIAVWDASGQLVSRSGPAPLMAFNAGQGFETLALGSPATQWRTFSRWSDPDRGRKITVMLSMTERDALAADIAEQVAAPGLWLLPVVALVLAFALHTGLRPLTTLTEQVNRLDVQKDITLVAPPHQEFRGIKQSIDQLIARYNDALARERELAAEVAHELRTPLASLRLNAAALQRQWADHAAAPALAQIQRDAERAAAVLTDLLALARASREALAQAQQPVDLAALARRVAAEFAQTAVTHQHDLSVDAPATCVIPGHLVLLELALRNLIENALAHTPPGSAVEVKVGCQPATLAVRDNGAAVAAMGQFPTPGRHLGWGLGHQVVRRVATVHGGQFEMHGPTPEGEREYRLVLHSPSKGA